ncbi:MAG: glycosyltransferase family 4 protein [Actinobacteria bacterium]|nr:glycosyltransferase family 4 protein [Actinomycetota bacterium]
MSKRRVVYVFDTTLDVRFVDSFSTIFELTLLSSSTAGTTNLAGGHHRTVRLDAKRISFWLKAALWLIRHRPEYDLVFGLDTLSAAAGCNLAKLITRRPLILVLLRPTVDYFRCRRLRGEGGLKYLIGLAAVRVVTWANCRLADVAVPCSHYIASQTSSRRIVVIPSYGVDTDAYVPTMTRTEARRLLDIEIDKPLIFCRSRIGREKDPETFLKAVAYLGSMGRDVQALYVGGEYLELLELAKTFGVRVIARNHVHPLTELPSYYIAADIAVQTSLKEGLGLSPLESACCGVPVVVSRTGGLVESIVEHETGLLAPVGDHRAVAEAIAWLLDHPIEGSEMAARVLTLGLDTP